MKKDLLNQIYQIHVDLAKQPVFHQCSTIPHGEYAIMKYLVYHQDHMEMLTVSQIAKKHHISQPAVSRTVKSLLDKGWISREENPQDRRMVYLCLTKEGQAIYHQQDVDFQAKLETVFSQLTDQEVEAWIRIGSKLVKIIEGLA